MKEQLSTQEIKPETCFVPATDKKGKGRSISVMPGETASRYLHYGRVILDAGDAPLQFDNKDHETGLVCLKGKASVSVNGQSFEFSPYDSIYIGRDSQITVEADAVEGCDFAEISAPVANKYPLQFVSFADVRSDSTLHFIAGQPPTQRDLNILLGKNVEAGRIMAGVTFSTPGNWTSFPPHEHSEMLEEAYLYIDMPAPQWGIQMVYTDLEQPELVQVVREGDVVLMPKGYHPNVAAPGGQINFLWMMAANREGVDRQFGVVNVHPDYAAGGSGLEAAHGKK
ncbi:MAG TPA: 5-deoxy-glucuronate isomerase [Pyrinomonadaceae bacterium]|nr:5-deoxy-glucuronate isomerase [Pyrinomonadaceae bacterium]